MPRTQRAASTRGTAASRPRWSVVLRALRDVAGVSQAGWVALLQLAAQEQGLAIAASEDTLQRWEAGRSVPDAAAEAAIVAVCRQRGLLRAYTSGTLAGETITAESLQSLLAEARLGGGRSAPVLQALPARPPSNLPAALSSFIGRERELTELDQALAGARLLTLTGTGGVGKTRLALELARTLEERFPEGVWLVELAPLAEPALMPRAVAAAVGVPETAARDLTDLMIERLHAARSLLLLDNCEHLSDAAAALVAALLRGCPSLRVLATSRQPLGIAGEHVWQVPPLSLPNPDTPPEGALAQSEAASLFIARAGAAGARITTAPDAAAAVAAICRRLDGIPLALELAAARTRALSVEQIAQRLAGSVRLLGSAGGTAQRHETIQAAIDWSHDLLTRDERTIFRRLAVFAGGFTLEAMESVCTGPSLDLHAGSDHDALSILVSLVDKSLVLMQPGSDGVAWYRLLEPLRQYAAEKLEAVGEATVLGERHRDWYLAFVEEHANPGLKGEKQAAWLTRLDQEKDNLRTALHWTAQHGPAEAGLRLISAVTDYWQMHGHLAEGLEWAETVLAAPESRRADPRRLVNALNHGAILGIRHGAYARARALLEEALELARAIEDPLLTGRTLNHLGILSRDEGDLAGAQTAWDTCLSIFEDLDERYGLAVTRTNLCMIARDRGQYDLAQAHGEAALALDRERADERGVSIDLHHLGLIALERDDLARATALHEEALALRRRLGFAYGLVGSLSVLGTLAALQGDFARAEPLFAESLALARRQGHRPGQMQTLNAYGQAVLDHGDGPAAALLAESLSLARELGDRIGAIQALAGLSQVARRDRDVEEAEALAQESLALARAMGFRKGVARALLAQGAARAARGDVYRAANCYREALAEARELDSVRMVAACFEGLAALHAPDAPARAAELLGAAAALRERIGVPLPRRERPAQEQLRALLCTALGDDACARAEAEGRATPMQTAIAEALGEAISPTP